MCHARVCLPSHSHISPFTHNTVEATTLMRYSSTVHARVHMTCLDISMPSFNKAQIELKEEGQKREATKGIKCRLQMALKEGYRRN